MKTRLEPPSPSTVSGADLIYLSPLRCCPLLHHIYLCSERVLREIDRAEKRLL